MKRQHLAPAVSVLVISGVSLTALFLGMAKNTTEPGLTRFFELGRIKLDPENGEVGPYGLEGQVPHVYDFDYFTPTNTMFVMYLRSGYFDQFPLQLEQRTLKTPQDAIARAVEFMEAEGYEPHQYGVTKVEERSGARINQSVFAGVPDEAICYAVQIVTKEEMGRPALGARRVLNFKFEAHEGQLISYHGTPRPVFGPWRVLVNESDALASARESFEESAPPSIYTELGWFLDRRGGGGLSRYLRSPAFAGYRFTFREPGWKQEQFISVVVHAETGEVIQRWDNSALHDDSDY